MIIHHRRFISLRTSLIIGVLFFLFTSNTTSLFAGIQNENPAAASSMPEEPQTSMVIKQMGNFPAFFIENQGQADGEVRYYFKGSDNVYFTDEGVVFQKIDYPREDPYDKYTRPTERNKEPETPDSVAYRLEFADARPTSPKARNELKGRVNYFIGNDRTGWRTDIPTYREIVYPELYPGCHSEAQPKNLITRPFADAQGDRKGGIDLVYKGVPGGMKYEFIVKPGADPNVIRLTYTGIDGLSIDDAGNLIIHTALGDVRDEKPYCYQMIGDKEVEVGCRFVIARSGCDEAIPGGNAENEIVRHGESASGMTSPSVRNDKYMYGFEVAEYNKDYPLVIDPGIIYSTFLGGSSSDVGYAIDIDSSGNMYVTGKTLSADFPTAATGMPYDTIHNGSWDVFVAKVNPAGAENPDLVYSTFIGGSGADYGYDIELDGSNNAYVTGTTEEDDTTDFPVTGGAYSTTHNGRFDAFVVKLNSTGTSLTYSTFLGGAEDDEGHGIDVDGSGNAYVTGWTQEDNVGSNNFPVEPDPGAYNTTHNGYTDVFVAIIDPAGNGTNDLIYSTFIGGTSHDFGYDIALDSSGNMFITGETFNAAPPGNDFPVTTGAYDTIHNGSYDAFVAELSADGSTLMYSTFLGGEEDDAGYGIAVGSTGHAFVTGATEKDLTKYTDPEDPGDTDVDDFPTTSGAYSTAHNGGKWDAFAAEVNPAGGRRYGPCLLHVSWRG